MEESNLLGSRHLTLVTTVLRRVGLWRQQADGFSYHMRTAFSSFCMLSLLYTQICYLPEVWNQDLKDFAITSYLAIAIFAAQFKVHAFVFMRSDLGELMTLLDTDLIPHLTGQKTLVLATLAGSVRHAKLLLVIFYGLGNVAISTWYTAPIIRLYVLPSDNTTALFLPLEAWHPFDAYGSHSNYGLAYLYQVVALYIVFITTVSIDIFYITVIIYLSAQLKILNHALVSVCQMFIDPNNNDEDLHRYSSEIAGVRSKLSSENENIANDSHQFLIQCIRHHQLIIRTVSKLQDIMGPSVFVQFFLNMITMCIYAFVLTVETSDVSTFAKFVLTMIVYAFQNFVYCLYGDQLIEQSEKLVFSCYESDWPDSNHLMKHCLRFIMRRASRPLEITVGKMYNLSRQTFLMLLNGSYSLFAVLHHING